MATRSQQASLESGSMPLEGQPRKVVRFDPTFNTGTIVQIVVIVASAFSIYTGLKTDTVQQKAELESVKASALVERIQTKESLADLKADVKEIQKTTNDVKESLAILRGRGSDTGARK
ncbi:MAG: hypothetical protein WKG52_00665 [Variovorax sp.]